MTAGRLLARVTYREARDAAEVLRTTAQTREDRALGLEGERAYRARAEALRRVADWIEQEAMRDE